MCVLTNSRCHFEFSAKSSAGMHLNKAYKKTLRLLGLCMNIDHNFYRNRKHETYFSCKKHPKTNPTLDF